jgi:hypothetical protein
VHLVRLDYLFLFSDAFLQKIARASSGKLNFLLYDKAMKSIRVLRSLMLLTKSQAIGFPYL